jgi:hypothetical protein
MTATPRSAAVRNQTQAVREFHYDDTHAGRPLYLLIPGGLIAVSALALIVYVFYAMFVGQTLETSQGFLLVALLGPVYIGGVFLFSYGYELYDMRKAIRLTAIVVITTVLIVVIIAVLFFLMGGSKGSSDSGSSSGSDKSSSGRGSSGGGSKGGFLSGIGSVFHTSSSSSSVSSGSGASNWGSWVGPIFDINFPTRTVTKTAVHQVNVPVAPKPITCENCGRSYIPAETNYTCPGCGAAAPRSLVMQSREGGDGSAMISADGMPLSAVDKKAAFETLTPQFRRRRGVFIQGRNLCLADVVSFSAADAGMQATLKAVGDPPLVGTIGETGLKYVEAASPFGQRWDINREWDTFAFDGDDWDASAESGWRLLFDQAAVARFLKQDTGLAG